MRAFEFSILDESSRGILFRSPGDIFTSTANPNDTLEFVSAKMFPEDAESFETPEERDQFIKSLSRKYPGLTWTNSSNVSTLAFAVVTLLEPKAKIKKHFGRYFKKIAPDMAGLWKNDGIPGYNLGIKSSLKSRSGLKPVDILQKDVQFPDVQSVINAIDHPDQEIKNGLNFLTKKRLPEFRAAKDLEPAIRDDLGETIAPLALHAGLISGEAEDARKFLLKNQPWSSCSITFPSKKNSGLIDSYLRPRKGVAIGISSKGADGAKASVSNIWSGIELLRKSGQESVVDQYPDAVEVLEIIKNESGITGPIQLGIKFGFCTEEDKRLIIESMQKGIQQVPSTPRWKNIRNFMSKFSARKSDQSNYNIGYHALAGLAKIVAEHINSNVPEFAEACLTFLNSSPLLQIHLYTTSSENLVKVSSFKTIWPPQFKGKISLNAGKSYYATGVQNKFAFGW
jgi:hypothetical protein